LNKVEQKFASNKQYVLYLSGIANKNCIMKKVTPRTIEAFLLKNWFSVALIGIVALALFRNGADSLEPIDVQFAQSSSIGNPPIQKMGMSFIPEFFGEKPVAEARTERAMSGRTATKADVRMDSRAQAFIDRFAEVAIQEHSKYNIPASVILANGILLSDLGHSTLANEAQNFFMVPCTRSWDGDSMEIGDGCFRWYGSPWESFRDHSLFVSREAGNSASKVSGKSSVVEWAKTIEKIGWTNLQAKFDVS